MADWKKSRVLLTLGQKVEAISELDNGVPAYKIAEKLGVGKTQIQNLRKRKAELMSDYENNVPSDSKRRRHFTGNEEINELTLAWVNDAIHRCINVTGPLIQTKAFEFSERLGITDFKASKGWLESFKKRNCLVFGTMSGERGDVKIDTVHNWKSKLPKLCENYEPADIFNMDETGLFFKDTTRKTFHVKGDDCAGGKRSNERITVALCASMAGEKVKPLVIGKSRRPRCFKNIQSNSLPVDYYYNKKAWMNSFIYKDFLKTFNRRIKSQKRNVLLFVDNGPSHPEVELSNVKVKFLPPNTTSFTQPMDQGIIQSTKLKFRKRQLKHMVKEMDRNATVCGSDILKQINILDAIYWLKNSWTEVEEHTIKRCFEKAGFNQIRGPEVDNEHSDNNDEYEGDDDDDIPLAAIKMVKDVFGCTFKELVSIDNSIDTCDNISFDWDMPPIDILKSLNNNTEDRDSDDSDNEVGSSSEETLTLADANNMVVKLKLFATTSGHPEILDCVIQLDEKLSDIAVNTTKQSKITEFFEMMRSK